MESRILGAHNVESATTRMTSLLIDEVIALNAGGLTSSLSLSEQEKVRAIMLTHCHYDHVREVGAIGLNSSYLQKTIEVYSLPSTLDMLGTHLVNGVYGDKPEPQEPYAKLNSPRGTP